MPRRNPRNNTIRVRSYTRRGQHVKSHRRRIPQRNQFNSDGFSYGAYSYRISSKNSLHRNERQRELKLIEDDLGSVEQRIKQLEAKQKLSNVERALLDRFQDIRTTLSHQYDQIIDGEIDLIKHGAQAEQSRLMMLYRLQDDVERIGRRMKAPDITIPERERLEDELDLIQKRLRIN